MMKEEIPDFLIEMSKQMKSQNNRLTADPLFEVRYKTHLITQEGYNDTHWEVVCEDGYTLYHSENSENLGILSEYLLDSDEGWCKSWCEENEIEFSADNFMSSFEDDFDFDFDYFDMPEGVRKFHMQEIEVTVNSHLTESDAQAFIDRKQHDYPKLYIHAISMCYCENMTKLRNWIKSL